METYTDSVGVKMTGWLNENGYIAYPKDLSFTGNLPDRFPIEIFSQDNQLICILTFQDENLILSGKKDEVCQNLAKKIASTFNVDVVII